MKNYNNKNNKDGLSYKKSGVDIDKANEAIALFQNKVKSTFDSNVISDLSSYAGLYKLDVKKFENPVLVSTTDGVGTKVLIAKELGNFSTIGQDLVAMNVNDVICCGADPLFFLDYIACGKLNPLTIKVIVESIAEACKLAGISLIGGETAEMPDVYKRDDIDLAGFCVGIVNEKEIILKENINEGDLIVGIKSSGPHSNGYSLIRKIIKDENLSFDKSYNLDADNLSLGELLLKPTRIYTRLIKELKKSLKIKGIAHITGGGFYENIRRIIPKNYDAEISKGAWEIPLIFKLFQDKGNIKEVEMFRVFNMGIGLVVIIDNSDIKKLKKVFQKFNEEVYVIGKIVKGECKVVIKD